MPITQRIGAKPGDLIVAIQGSISENCELFGISTRDLANLTVDFAQVTYINSVGVKNWISWTGRLPKELWIRFIQCPPVIVNQIGLVKGFLPQNGSVESFFVPYFCETCSREDRQLMERGVHFAKPGATEPWQHQVPDKIECRKCKGSMDMDMVPDRLLSFIKMIA